MLFFQYLKSLGYQEDISNNRLIRYGWWFFVLFLNSETNIAEFVLVSVNLPKTFYHNKFFY